MTAQPIDISSVNPQGTQSVVAPQTSSAISKSKGVNVSNPYGKLVTSPAPSSVHTTEAASLDISPEGVSLLKNAERGKISSPEAAKTLMKDVSESIKSNTDAARSLHSNLRIMKINQLLFD